MGSQSSRNAALIVALLIVVVAVLYFVNKGRTQSVRTPTAARPSATHSPGTGPAATRLPQNNPGTAMTSAPRAGEQSQPLNGSKEQPVAQVFKGCPAQGDGGDPELNVLKNRIDDARGYQATDINTIVGWNWPKSIERNARKNWAPADAKAIEQHEGFPVVVEGYLAGAKEEGEESPNCHAVDQHDYHIWMVPQAGQDRTRSLVVELTPRIRALHPQWDISVLRQVVSKNVPVRVTGWTMMDPEHPDQVGKTRGTIWEVHPIMHFEVQSGGKWIDLGQWNGQ
ncbi:MAG: hypothetical protein NVSMB42_26100 [Herpetosiphon sp.]